MGAGAGVRNWSTYGFIVDKRRNRLDVDRARKLVYAHFNVRLLRKVRAVDYHSEYFEWDVEDEVKSDAEVLEVENEVSAESENSEDSATLTISRAGYLTYFYCTNRERKCRYHSAATAPYKRASGGCRGFCRFAIHTQAWSSLRVEGLRSNWL